MTPDAAVDLIANRLGKRGAALDAEIIAELQAAQIEMEEMPELPWFLLTQDTALAITAQTRTTALPSTFLLEDDYGGMFIVDSADSTKRHRVTKKDYEVLRASSHYEGTDNRPEAYAIQGSTIYWFPRPDIGYTAELWYYRKDPNTIAAAGAANLWLTHAPSVLYNLAGANVAKFLRFPDTAAMFDGDYRTSLARMMAQSEARRQAGFFAEMGG